MVKTIQLREGLEITLANDSLWFEEYRDQFGQDILPTLMPLILAVGNSISALAEEAGSLEEIDKDAFIRVLGSESMLDVGLRFSSFEISDIMHIMWAMAKAYDPNIEDPKAWQRKLAGPDHESLPIADVIVPALAELVVKGVVSSKNWERLTADAGKIKSKLQPEKKTKKTTKKK